MERYPTPKYSFRLHPRRKYVPFECGMRGSWGPGYPPVKASKMSEVKNQNKPPNNNNKSHPKATENSFKTLYVLEE